MNKENPEIVAENVIYTGAYQVIEVNMSDSTENLYAVCTPVKQS